MQHNFLVAEAVLVTTLFSILAFQIASAQIPAMEVDALLEFKANYISKASQHVLHTWKRAGNTSDICKTWAGVRCTRSGLHIHAINLTSFTLEGSVAPHLGNLSFLQILDLSGNAFSGSIPLQLKGCTTLKVLNLNDNLLTGAIPASLSSLSSLQFLALCNNSLSGGISPAIVVNCTSLLSVSLCLNALTGPIPAMNLPNIEELMLWGNKLTGAIPPSLGNATSLIAVQLYLNGLTGLIPAELGLLHRLQDLELFTNNLTGAIPPSLGNCTSLTYLELGYNYNLTGPIPIELGFLNKLQVLRLSASNLVGPIPPSLGNCTYLKDLELKDDHLTGVIPAELGQLSYVRYADLSQNNLTGKMPPSLGNCTNLWAFSVESNQLNGNIPAEFAMLGQLRDLFLARNKLVGHLQMLNIGNLTNLQVLKLRINQFSGSIPIALGLLKLLQGIDLSSNDLTGEIPWESLSNCTPLSFIDLSDNRLNGGITSYLGKIQRLQNLYLQGNLLQGEIPESEDYSNLSLLDVDLSFNQLNGVLPASLSHALSTIGGGLFLSHNDFSGSLPYWLGQLVSATVIVLSHNYFSGGIPESLGDCVALLRLDLSQNKLSGNLPLQLGQKILFLEGLHLSYNNLSGVLPSFLATRLDKLRVLNVSFNNFSGPIPTGGVFRFLDASSFLGNPGLCGHVVRKACNVSQAPKKPGDSHHHGFRQLRSWKGALLMAGILLALLIVLAFVLLVVWHYRLLHRPVADNVLINRLAGTKRYSAQEIMEATQGYAEVNLLGQGGVGMVYKGVLTDGKVVAVKKLKDVCNEKALLSEMHILGKLRHRNLVRILGCVLNLDVKALILEYMENGSLRHYLDVHLEHMNQTEQIESSMLSYWEMLTKVTAGVAQALAYLHYEYGAPIIHGDVKPSNILLDSGLEPRLGDFGLAKLNEREAGVGVSLSSNFKGSIGYMAPEYAYAGRITVKVDVYAYGVVLLEMLTGKKPTEVFPDGLNLHEWVKSNLSVESDMKDMLDASLHSSQRRACDLHISAEQPHDRMQIIMQLLQLGVVCTEDHPDQRPTIQEVLLNLRGSQSSKGSLGAEG